MDNAVANLADQFLQLILPTTPISKKGAEGRWRDVWMLLADDAWFKIRLRQMARGAARFAGLDASQHRDIEQDVLLRLGRRLRKNPTLGWDRRRTAEDFGGWMSEILSRECCCVALRTSKKQRPFLAGRMEDRAATRDEPRTLELQVDFVVAMNRLSCQQRTVVHMHLKDKSIREIAALIDTTWWRARRILRDAIDALRATLSHESDAWIADIDKSAPSLADSNR